MNLAELFAAGATPDLFGYAVYPLAEKALRAG
jgi:hypothetical protein